MSRATYLCSYASSHFIMFQILPTPFNIFPFGGDSNENPSTIFVVMQILIY